MHTKPACPPLSLSIPMTSHFPKRAKHKHNEDIKSTEPANPTKLVKMVHEYIVYQELEILPEDLQQRILDSPSKTARFTWDGNDLTNISIDKQCFIKPSTSDWLDSVECERYLEDCTLERNDGVLCGEIQFTEHGY